MLSNISRECVRIIVHVYILLSRAAPFTALQFVLLIVYKTKNYSIILFSYPVFTKDIDISSFINQAPYCVHMIVFSCRT